MPDAVLAVARELGGDLLARGGHAREMRRGIQAAAADLHHGLERALARGPARTEGDREKARPERGERLPGRAQLSAAFVGLGREKFETEIALHDGDLQLKPRP